VHPGGYRVGYTAEVQFFADRPGAVLYCAVADLDTGVGYFDRTIAIVPGTGQWTRIAASDTVDVAESTLSLGCTPDSSGTIGVGWRGASVTAVPLAR
jgi:hypothetical protein